MPVYNPDLIETEGFPPAATALQNLLLEYDGLMIASPEYNASLPAGLKNMIDWTSRANGNLKLGDCYRGKVAAIMTASPGNFGGIRCLRHLRDILTLLLVHTLPVEIAVPRVGTLFEAESHEINDAVMRGTLENLGALLAETVRKLHGKTDAVPAK